MIKEDQFAKRGHISSHAKVVHLPDLAVVDPSPEEKSRPSTNLLGNQPSVVCGGLKLILFPKAEMPLFQPNWISTRGKSFITDNNVVTHDLESPVVPRVRSPVESPYATDNTPPPEPKDQSMLEGAFFERETFVVVNDELLHPLQELVCRVG